jgi:hypothetical protein
MRPTGNGDDSCLLAKVTTTKSLSRRKLMITILLTTIATATLLIDSAERLLADLTHLVCAAKSLLASLRRSKQNTQVQETSAEKE